MQPRGLRLKVRKMLDVDMRDAYGETRRAHILFASPMVRVMDDVLGTARMRILLSIIIIVVLILGPLRRQFFKRWRFNVPALCCGVASFLLTSASLKPEDPRWLPLAVSLAVALGGGAAFKQWLDNVFGKDSE
jgi:hypothetical protein